MGAPERTAAFQEVRDWYGRRYRVGEDPVDLIGRPRSSVLRMAWVPMAAVGVLQYGYGAAVPALMARNGWGLVGAFWLLAVWIVFQAGVGFPTAYLRERRRLDPRAVMIAGAALSALGLVALAHTTSLGAALLGYSVLGGTGAGLVYAACTSTVAKWYPERMALRVSRVTGVFAYGSVPFIVAAVVGLHAGNITLVFDVAAVVLFVLVAGAGMFFRDPPARWWPAEVDPRAWGLGATGNPGRRKNPPAVREYSAMQAIRTRVMPVLYVILLAAGAVSLFNAAFVVVFASGFPAGIGVIALAAGVLAGVNGAGRAVSVGISDRVGRCRTLNVVLLVQAVAQTLFALAASTQSSVAMVLAAVLAGIGGGGFYPLFASIAREYFGEQSAFEVHGLVYSAKALGGLLGVGLAAIAVSSWGFAVTFLVAAFVSLGAAWATGALQRPGLPSTLPSARVSKQSAVPSRYAT
ncbi:OFA family MFS transporter [Pseudonocardia yunnanensis]|uniref:OFA family MFS transporter n=1 Tax=Pseudonocardia yunnanensis TaxID=58107 RepID=A0ABW4F3A8_9PSEU